MKFEERDGKELEQIGDESSFFKTLIESTRDPVYVLDPNDGCRMVYANRAACLHFGLDKEHLLTMRIPDWDPVFDMNSTNIIMNELKKGKQMHFETVHRISTGELVPVEVTCNYLEHDGRELTAGFFYDIRKRKEMENALKASERNLIDAQRIAHVGNWTKDCSGSFISASDECYRILGISGNDFAGTAEAFLDLIHPDDRDRYRAAVWTLLRTSIPYSTEYRVILNEGGERFVQEKGETALDNSGTPVRIIGTVHDITERKKLERQLVQAQKMESIGVLAGGIAHDFNNLLTAISGYGQIVLEGVAADDNLIKDAADQVLRAAERAAELTRSLLAFSRRQVMNPQALDIETLINNTAKLIRRIIGEDIEFETSISEQNLLVRADAGQIEQVLMNLATNARDAMPDGGILSLSIDRASVTEGSETDYDLPAAGEYALISVTDTGTGIADESLGRLFEPFYTTKEVGKGTGLGLSIVHGIIKQHNGSVLVSSETGRGTTFRIYLPLAESLDTWKRPVSRKPISGGAETLLVAEDDEIVKAFLSRILEGAGYSVITADDGKDALAKFRAYSDEISLVLTDVVMPGKNGKELVEEIRRVKPGMRVVFLSGYPTDIVSNLGIIDNGVDFISKPFLKNDLLRKLRYVLDNE